RTVLLHESLRRTVRAAAQAVHVLAEHDDARVLRHPAVHRLRHRVDELDLAPRALPGLRLTRVETGEFGRIASDARVDHRGIGPQLRPDPLATGVVRVAFGEGCDSEPHGLLRLLPDRTVLLGRQQREAGHLARDPGERIALAPLLLLGLRAVAERAAGVGTVLMEE